MIYKRRNYHE